MELQEQSKDRSQITAAIGTAIGTRNSNRDSNRNRNNSSSAVKRKACAGRVYIAVVVVVGA